MKTERIEEPEITLITPKVEASSCPPYGGGGTGPCPPAYPDGSCRPNCSPSCNPNCQPACDPSVLPRDCPPIRGEPRPPRPPGPN